MADEVLGREVVEFAASGLAEILAETERLEEYVQRAYVQQVALNQSMNDQSLNRRREGIERLGRSTQATMRAEKARVDLADRAGRLRSGAFLSNLKQENTGRLRSDGMSIRERRATLESGEYLRNRKASGNLAGQSGDLSIRERQAALASGLLAKEVALESRLRGDIERLAAAEKLLVDQSLLKQRHGNLASGEFVQRQMGVDRTKHETQRLALGERRALLQSGHFADQVRRRETNRIEEGKLERAERSTELRALHGKIGGSLIGGLERARPAMLAAGGVAAVGVGMAKSGFANTVEGNALAMEMHLLNREIAGTLMPVLRDLTGAFRWARQKMEKLTGGQQNAVGYTIAGAAGIGALGLAVGTITKMVGGLATVASVMGLRAGASVAGSAGGSIAASVAGSAIGGAAAGGTGAAVAAGGGAAAAASRFGRVGRAIGAAGRMMPWLTIASSAYEATTGGFYDSKRQQGHSKFASGVYATGAGFMDTLSKPLKWMGLIDKEFGDAYRDREVLAGRRKKDGADGASSGHRTPLIADGGFESFDDAYKRVATAVSVQAAVGAESSGGLMGSGSGAIESRLDELIRLSREAAIRAGLPPLR